MKVFLGWSGDRSKSLAEALREWLPLVLHYAEPWMSQGDIAAGERWSPELASELEASNFGIISITPENVSDAWIQFEAGSLAKSLQEAKVVPLLLGIEVSEISGPLAQFQAKKAEHEGLRDVIDSINRSAKDPLDEPRKNQLFGALWPTLKDKIDAIPPQPEAAKPKRSQHEVLEELVTSVRSFDSRLRSIEEMAEANDIRRDRLRRHQPRMFLDMMHHVGVERRDPLMLLMFASAIRDDLPWLYELTMDVYREAVGGGSKAVDAYRRLAQTLEMVRHHPIVEEIMRTKENYILMREMEHFVMEMCGREEPPPRKMVKLKPKVNPDAFK